MSRGPRTCILRSTEYGVLLLPHFLSFPFCSSSFLALITPTFSCPHRRHYRRGLEKGFADRCANAPRSSSLGAAVNQKRAKEAEGAKEGVADKDASRHRPVASAAAVVFFAAETRKEQTEAMGDVRRTREMGNARWRTRHVGRGMLDEACLDEARTTARPLALTLTFPLGPRALGLKHVTPAKLNRTWT